jgi:sugar O-acyltransferase (sialic acid O-acetyltransferase NeuD family)
MIEDIAIIGAGGFGREVALLIDVINQNETKYNIIGFFDDNISPGTKVTDLSVLGSIDDLNNVTTKLRVVIAIGNPKVICKINQRLNNSSLLFPNIFHPSLKISNNRMQIGVGNIFMEGFIMTCNIRIGNFNIFNTRVSLGHDVKIGSFNVLNPNTQISGGVKIEDANFFGVNSCILQNISIGNNNLIGAYSLLTRRILNDKDYFGIPAKQIKE